MDGERFRTAGSIPRRPGVGARIKGRQKRSGSTLRHQKHGDRGSLIYYYEPTSPQRKSFLGRTIIIVPLWSAQEEMPG